MYILIGRNLPAFDRNFFDLWGGCYGIWMLVVELTLCVSAAVILNSKKLLEKEPFLVAGTACAVFGVVMNRLNDTIHGFSVPNFPWKDFPVYSPTLSEWAITVGALALMVLIYMIFARYFPLFPHLEKKHR
jgi:Ni/Fe-hydrogenase subunit HybB-like protein